MPFSSSTRTGSTAVPGRSPAIPTPSPWPAAITPATCVPWPSRSSLPSPPGDTRSRPGSTEPTRSGWSASTPLSTTATVTSAAPGTLHSAGASRPRSSHCRGRSGSVPRSVAVTTLSISTLVVPLRRACTRSTSPASSSAATTTSVRGLPSASRLWTTIRTGPSLRPTWNRASARPVASLGAAPARASAGPPGRPRARQTRATPPARALPRAAVTTAPRRRAGRGR